MLRVSTVRDERRAGDCGSRFVRASAPENDAVRSPHADMRQTMGRTSRRRAFAPRTLAWVLAWCLFAQQLICTSAFKYTSTSDNGKRIAVIDIDDPANSTEFELHGYTGVYNVARDHAGDALYAAGRDASDSTATTLYRVNETDGSLTVVSSIPYSGAAAYPVGFDPSGKLWMISGSKLLKLDGDDFAVSSVLNITDAATDAAVTGYMDLSFHPETGVLYTVGSGRLSTLNVDTGVDTVIASSLDTNIMGLAWDETGTRLYATDYATPANIHEADYTTGATSALGDTGLSKLHGFTQMTNRKQSPERFTAVGVSIAAAVIVTFGTFYTIRARSGNKVQAAVAPSQPVRLDTAV